MAHIWRPQNKLPIVGPHFIPFMYRLHYCCLINCLLFNNHQLWGGAAAVEGAQLVYQEKTPKMRSNQKRGNLYYSTKCLCLTLCFLHKKNSCIHNLIFPCKRRVLCRTELEAGLQSGMMFVIFANIGSKTPKPSLTDRGQSRPVREYNQLINILFL